MPVTHLLAGITEDLDRDGFAFRAANDMRSILRLRGLDAWPALAVSEQISLSRDVVFHSLQRCKIPSAISTVRPRSSGLR
jgi:hypothetical protein